MNIHLDENLRLTPKEARQILVDFIATDEDFGNDIDLNFYMSGVWMARFIKNEIDKEISVLANEMDEFCRDTYEKISHLEFVKRLIDKVTNEQHERERTRK